MSREKTISNSRKIIYACIFLAVVAVVATVIAVSTADSGSKIQAEKPSASVSAPNSSVTQPSSTGKPSTSEKQPESHSSQPSTPTVKEIAFAFPVAGGEVVKDYTDATVTFNKTLGVYTGHLALDIGGAENANVLAAYEGEVESIVNTYLEGTSVTVNHGNGLKTVYNSIDVADGIEVGKMLAKGDIIGVISVNNRQEYKDGAHLHFEVWENGLKISPYKYLTVDEK